VKLGLGSDLVANFTVNTDFAGADVDNLQFNLTPYKLFFSQKLSSSWRMPASSTLRFGGDSGDLLFFSRNIGIDPITVKKFRSMAEVKSPDELVVSSWARWTWRPVAPAPTPMRTTR
jgi:hypothetical protein